MRPKLALRVASGAALIAAVLLLASCNGVGANTGSVTLTVYNGNNPTAGTFVYKNVYVDNKVLVSDSIQAGQSMTVKVEPGQHTMFYTFEASPNTGGGGTYLHNSGSGNDTFTIPTGSTLYTWTGPVWPNQ